MFTRDHSRRRSGRPAADDIDTFAIETRITATTTAVRLSTLSGHFPFVIKNRSEAAARAFHSPFPDLPSRSRSLTNSPQSASEALIKGYPREPPVNSPVQNVHQLTIDIIGYILSQMAATCRRGDERQAAISINAGLRERSWCRRSGQRSDCTDSLASDPNRWRFGMNVGHFEQI